MSNVTFRFPTYLQYFSEPEPEPTDPPAEPPADDPEPTKTFSQEDLDKIVADRIARERKKYADYEDVKKKAEEYEKALEEKRLAELSEKERLEELAKKYEAEKQTLSSELEQMRESVKREKIVNEFIKVATALNIAYIDDALKLADLSAVTVDEEGVKGVKEAVEALVQHKPFLLSQSKKEPKTIGSPSNPNPDGGQKTAEQLLKEAADKARRTGRIEDRMAYAQLKSELGL